MAVNGVDKPGCPFHGSEMERFFQEGKEAMQKIHAMHEGWSSMKHLDQLPQQTRVLEDIRTNLIAPATGAGRVPLSVFVIVSVVLGTMLILKEVKQGQTLNITPSGVQIGVAPVQPEQGKQGKQ